MLHIGNVFDRINASIKYNLKKIEIKVERVNEKLPTLENARIGPSVVSLPVPTYLHMHALGGIDVSALFYQFHMLINERHLDREKINLPEYRLNAGMDSFDLNYNHTAR